jgi:hypothetical protein
VGLAGSRGISYGIRDSVTDQSARQLVESIDILCRNTQCSTVQVEPASAHGTVFLGGG